LAARSHDSGGKRRDGAEAPAGAGPCRPEAAPPRAAGSNGLTRRAFIAGAGATGVSVYSLGHRAPAALASALKQGPPNYPFTFQTILRRRDDALNLTFNFYNLKLDTTDPANPKLVYANLGQGAALVVEFAPQNIAEQAFLEAAKEFEGVSEGGPLQEEKLTPENKPGSVLALAARQSRLAFNVPPETTIPFTVEGLLTWTGLSPLLVPDARVVAKKKERGVREPKPYETSIELPWRLILSPNEFGTWDHALEPVTHQGRTELWHTSLTYPTPGRGGVNFGRTVAAVWTRDPKFAEYLKAAEEKVVPEPEPPEPFRMSLTARDRYAIVRLSSDYSIKKHEPQGIEVNRLMLSSLGGFVDLMGEWVPPKGFDLTEWRHKGTLGRDHYVRIVRVGYLFPFGHAAVLVKVTERRFNAVPKEASSAPRAAYLRQRFFILVRNPDKDYGGVGRQPDGGRGFPFKQVHITTLVTPNLEAPAPFAAGYAGIDVFQPAIPPKTPFQFHMIGTDWAGAQSEFTTPVVFVGKTVAESTNEMKALEEKYPTAPPAQRTADLQGHSVALAASAKAGDTNVEAHTVTWASKQGTAKPAPGDPTFWPTMAQAGVSLSAAAQVSGTNVDSTIEYFKAFVESGFGKGEVFAQLTKEAPLKFGADKSGGVATPNFSIGGLSRMLGPVAHPKTIAEEGKFDPSKYLDDAKLLGGVALGELFKAIELATGTEEAMKLVQTTLPDRVEANLHWEAKPPTLQKDPLGIFVPADDGSFTLDVHIVTMLAQPDSTFTVTGHLNKFEINLLGEEEAIKFLTLKFNQLQFSAQKGQKSNVTVDLEEVTFSGVLEFVKDLEEIMSLGEEGPAIDLEPTGITAKFAVPIPTIAVGVFAISNLSFSAGVSIPFSGDPVRARFGFSERANPFQLQISMFGGGGFFALGVGADGIELLEAALEFGATVSLDIGVASGGIYIMAGIYFKFETSPTETVELTGYIRAGGELNVLELVSLSIELYMGITYQKIGEVEKVIGQAILKLEVHVFIFSATLEEKVERHFGNSAGDPTFAELMPPEAKDPDHSAAWTEYCAAFAAI
jgi:hypothetical protein